MIILVDHDKASIIVPFLAWFYSSSGYASNGTTLQEYNQSLEYSVQRCSRSKVIVYALQLNSYYRIWSVKLIWNNLVFCPSVNDGGDLLILLMRWSEPLQMYFSKSSILLQLWLGSISVQLLWTDVHRKYCSINLLIVDTRSEVKFSRSFRGNTWCFLPVQKQLRNLISRSSKWSMIKQRLSIEIEHGIWINRMDARKLKKKEVLTSPRIRIVW